MLVLFTIISLVIAVTGSVYTGLTGLRLLLNKYADELWESARFCKNKADEEGSKSDKSMARAAYGVGVLGKWLWRIASASPILILAAYSCYTSYQVVGLYDEHQAEIAPELARSEPAENESLEPISQSAFENSILACCNRHMLYLFAITTANLICIPLMLLGFALVWAGHWWLEHISTSITDRNEPLTRPSV